MKESEVTSKIVETFKSITGTEVDPSVPLVRYGIESTSFVEASEMLSSALKSEFEPELFWEFETVNEIAKAFSERVLVGA